MYGEDVVIIVKILLRNRSRQQIPVSSMWHTDYALAAHRTPTIFPGAAGASNHRGGHIPIIHNRCWYAAKGFQGLFCVFIPSMTFKTKIKKLVHDFFSRNQFLRLRIFEKFCGINFCEKFSAKINSARINSAKINYFRVVAQISALHILIVNLSYHGVVWGRVELDTNLLLYHIR